MIEVKNLDVAINGVEILSKVSATFNDGEIVGIIGKSGSGKTVFMKAVTGLLNPARGTVLFNGAPLPRTKKEREKTACMYLNAVPHNPDEALHDFLMLARIPHKKLFRPFSEYDRQVAEEYIEILGLTPYRDMRSGDLSDGIFRRMMLAYTFAKESGAVFLDNPMNDLDIESIRMLHKALSRYVLNGNRTAVVCSNDLNFVSHTADRILVMDAGRIAETGGVEILNADIIKQYFGIEVIISRNIYNGKPEIHLFPET